MTEGATVKELAEKMERKSKDIIRSLMVRGVLATINQPLDADLDAASRAGLRRVRNILWFLVPDSMRAHFSFPGGAARFLGEIAGHHETVAFAQSNA